MPLRSPSASAPLSADSLVSCSSSIRRAARTSSLAEPKRPLAICSRMKPLKCAPNVMLVFLAAIGRAIAQKYHLLASGAKGATSARGMGLSRFVTSPLRSRAFESHEEPSGSRFDGRVRSRSAMLVHPTGTSVGPQRFALTHQSRLRPSDS